ncbi:MAG: MFS transporter [Beijerinckiaceae bacterium]
MTTTTDHWRPTGALRIAIPVLGLTQMIGWGTTYYLPGVLGDAFQRDLGLSDGMVFAAITVMLVTSALLGWPVGRIIDKHGAGKIMPIGSLLMATGLVILHFASGAAVYFLAWFCMGLAMPMTLSSAAFAAMAQMAGQHARRAIGMLMLFGGMAATVFWPLTLWLDTKIGWRSTVLIYAFMHVLICLPLHVFFLRSAVSNSKKEQEPKSSLTGTLLPEHRGKAAVLLVLISASSGFASWGLDLHLIAILTDFGLTATTAVAIAALKGPATILARATDVLSAGRMTPIVSAMLAGLLMPLGLVAGLLTAGKFYGAVIFIIVFSFGTGLMTIARATLPLTLLGSIGYATTLGKVALPTQLVLAASPTVFGIIIGSQGVQTALTVGFVSTLISLVCLYLLMKLQRTSLQK